MSQEKQESGLNILARINKEREERKAVELLEYPHVQKVMKNLQAIHTRTERLRYEGNTRDYAVESWNALSDHTKARTLKLKEIPLIGSQSRLQIPTFKGILQLSGLLIEIFNDSEVLSEEFFDWLIRMEANDPAFKTLPWVELFETLERKTWSEIQWLIIHAVWLDLHLEWQKQDSQDRKTRALDAEKERQINRIKKPLKTQQTKLKTRAEVVQGFIDNYTKELNSIYAELDAIDLALERVNDDYTRMHKEKMAEKAKRLEGRIRSDFGDLML